MSPDLAHAPHWQRRGAAPICLAAVLALFATPPAAAQELEPVPRPAFEQMAPEVAEQLGELQATVERLAADEAVATGELAELYGRLGALYLLYNLDRAAEAALANAHALVPGEPRWSYYLGALFQRQRRNAAAAEKLADALAAWRRGGEATARYVLPTMLRLGRVAFNDGRNEEARQFYDSALELAPSSAAALFGLAQVDQASGRLEAAIERYERVLELAPEAGAAHYQLALAYRAQGDTEAARRHLEQRGENRPAFADPLMDRLDASARGAYFATFRAARAALDGELEEAAELYRRALASEPENHVVRQAYALVLARMNEVDAAIRELETIVSKAPEMASAHFHLGTALATEERSVEALEHLERAAGLDPENADIRSTLAALYESEQRFEDAERSAAEAARLRPESAQLQFEHGRLLAMLGRADSARGAFERVLALDPTHAEARFSLGVLLERAGRTAEALDEFTAVAETATGSLAGRAALRQGALLLEAGSVEAATEAFAIAVEGMPDSLPARLGLANTLARVGRFAEAAAAFERALELDSANQTAHLGRALASLYAGDERAARDRLEASLERLPDNLGLEHLLARLLATARDETVRDAARALTLAQSVFERQQTGEHAETLAMALAATGRFEAAADLQRQILEQARAAGATELLAAIERRLQSYERREPAVAPWQG